jgi:hypothetical protein
MVSSRMLDTTAAFVVTCIFSVNLFHLLHVYDLSRRCVFCSIHLFYLRCSTPLLCYTERRRLLTVQPVGNRISTSELQCRHATLGTQKADK